MVRKWSYLKPIKLDYLSSNRLYLTPLYNFKVFKATTRFKKYSIGLTKFVRKSLAKRKHKTNWLVFSYALQRWLFFYLKNKQFIRYYQAMGMFNITSVGASPSFITKQQDKFVLDSGLFFLSCSKSILNAFFFKKQNFLTSPLYNNQSTLMLSSDINELNQKNELSPGLLIYDNVIYPYNYIVDTKYNQLLFKINNNLFTFTLKFILNIYKIIIKLSLLVIKKY